MWTWLDYITFNIYTPLKLWLLTLSKNQEDLISYSCNGIFIYVSQ